MSFGAFLFRHSRLHVIQRGQQSPPMWGALLLFGGTQADGGMPAVEMVAKICPAYFVWQSDLGLDRFAFGHRHGGLSSDSGRGAEPLRSAVPQPTSRQIQVTFRSCQDFYRSASLRHDGQAMDCRAYDRLDQL